MAGTEPQTGTVGATLQIDEDNGRCLHTRMARARVSEEDVLEAARRLQGIERIEQIKYAVPEFSGGISIIPYR